MFCVSFLTFLMLPSLFSVFVYINWGKKPNHSVSFSWIETKNSEPIILKDRALIFFSKCIILIKIIPLHPHNALWFRNPFDRSVTLIPWASSSQCHRVVKGSKPE